MFFKHEKINPSDGSTHWKTLYTITPQSECTQHFEDLCDYISKSEFYKDPHCHIEITKDAIHVGHPLSMLLTILPELPKYCGVPVYTEAKNAKTLCDYSFYVSFESPQQDEFSLLEEAEEYFKNQTPSLPDRPVFENIPSNALTSLVTKNEGLIIGEEDHSSGASKKLLMDNMLALKSAGVDTLFLEHFPETLKDVFADYYSSKSPVLPKILQKLLYCKDNEFCSVPFRKRETTLEYYNFTNLVIAAKQCGIKVIPFETEASYESQSSKYVAPSKENDHHRIFSMNYLSAKAIEEYKQTKSPESKYIVFVGGAHLSKDCPISSCPSVLGVENTLDSTHKSAYQDACSADFVVSIPREELMSSTILTSFSENKKKILEESTIETEDIDVHSEPAKSGLR